MTDPGERRLRRQREVQELIDQREETAQRKKSEALHRVRTAAVELWRAIVRDSPVFCRRRR